MFFLCLVAACTTHKGDTLKPLFKDGKAVAILVPGDLIRDINKYALTVSLNGSDRSILGSFSQTDSGVLFEPVIPLSAGMEYGVLQANIVIGKITIPATTGVAPQVVAIYPKTDTVPENLLKFYIEFSEPMRTGNALEHIFLLDKNRDTLQRIFLDLKPELWDPADKQLTVWIDPGRIKRDLVLNKELGNPLHTLQTYELVISGNWKDHRGLALGKNINKKFTVGQRVDAQLDIKQWYISAPKAGTKQPLTVQFNYPLDHFLLQESLNIFTGNGETVKGDVSLVDNDKTWMFTPSAKWTAGSYKLRANARLEDLAGNNLNKVFDRDIYKQKKNDNKYYERRFEVKK